MPSPLHIHLLGKGDPRDLVKIQQQINAIKPNVTLSGDSVATGGVVGKGRKLTVAMNKIIAANPNMTRADRGAARGKVLANIEQWKREEAINLTRKAA